MRLLRFALAPTVLCLLAACNAPPRLDLRHNENLYQPTGYVATVPVDRAAFVAPLVDERQPLEDKSANPIAWLNDRDWERPVTAMVAEILRDELRAANVFKDLLDAPQPDALLVRPILRAFDGGLEEQLYGRRSLARVALQLEVYGPEIAGDRKLMVSQPFFERQTSNIGFRPPSPRVLMGMALHATMSKLVVTVDSSNVARDGLFKDADLRKQ